MSDIVKKGMRNVLFVSFSQGMTLLLGLVRVFILTRILSISSMASVQTYALYTSYMGIITLGFCDGIYLKYAQYDYANFPKEKVRISIYVFMIYQVVITLLLMAIFYSIYGNTKLPILLSLINIPLVGLNATVLYILQITNQLRKYSFYIIFEKLVTIITIILFMFLKTQNYLIIIFMEIIIKSIVVLMLVLSHKELFFGKLGSFKDGLLEMFDDITIGAKLMVSYYSSVLILGFSRFFVQINSSELIFSNYSFAMQIIALILVFIHAISMVIYPSLKRIDEIKYGSYYMKIDKILMFLLPLLFISYFPIVWYIKNFMSEYIAVIGYLSLIYAIGFMQSKMSVLIKTFYEALRLEKKMMIENVIGVFITIILVMVSNYIYPNIYTTIIATLVSVVTINIRLEFKLSKVLKINIIKNTLLQMLYLIIFIIFTHYLNTMKAMVIYLIVLLFYYFLNIKEIKSIIKVFKR